MVQFADLQRRVRGAKSKGLGGAFIFEVTGDYFADRPAADRHPLLSAARTAIKTGFVDAP